MDLVPEMDQAEAGCLSLAKRFDSAYMATPKDTPTMMSACSMMPVAENESFSRMVDMTKLEFRMMSG